MAVINFACCIKTKRRQQLRYFYSSHTVHLLNKHRTASRLNNNNLRLSSLQYDIDQSIELDKTSLFESLSPNSTRDCFKYLRSLTRKRLLNQMHWKDKKATNSFELANLMNDYFCSVFLPRSNSALFAHDNPSILLTMLQISDVQVETSLDSASTTGLTNDNLPTFVLSNRSNIIAPLVVQLFVCPKYPTMAYTLEMCSHNTHLKNKQSRKC